MSAKEFKLQLEQNGAAPNTALAGSKKYSIRLYGFILASMALALCFVFSLYDWVRLAVSDELYSDLPLIPLVSLYLVWMRRQNLPRTFCTDVVPAIVFIVAGAVAACVYWVAHPEYFTTAENSVAIRILALLLFFMGICLLFFGKTFIYAVAFPAVLLVFAIPLPTPLRIGLETVLQHGSAVCAGGFFQLSDTPALRDGLIFHLTNCSIRVAPECSGIHSSMVLLVTSLLGGWLFLRSPWKRVMLALVVIPLAFIRNGLRIFFIGRLCADYGPQMLNSPIHRHGGPLFFALSLIPLYMVLLFLRKTERTKPATHPSL